MQLFRTLLGSAAENELENQKELQQLKHFLVFTLFGVPTMAIFAVYNFFVDNQVLVLVISLTGIGLAAGCAIQIRHPKTMVVYRSCAVLYCFLLLYMFALGGEGGSKSLWLYTFPLIAFFVLGKKEGAVWAFALLVLLTMLYFIPVSFISVYPYSIDFIIRLLMVYIIISGVSAWFEYFRSIYYEQIQQGNERFMEILKNSRDILYRRNIRTGKYDYISDAFFKQLGYSRKEMLKTGYGDVEFLIHPDDRERHGKFVEQALHDHVSGEADHNVEYRMRHADGHYYWFSDKIAVVHDRDGKPDHIIGSNREISHLRNTRLALEQSREQLFTILNGLDAHIYVADMENHRILFMNKKMKKDFAEDLEGKICWKEFRKADSPCPHCSNKKLLNSDQQPTGLYEWECHNPLLKRWYYNYDRAIQWVDGRWVRLQIAVDITRNKEIEEEKKKNEEILRRANHLESIGCLAGGIAHDFNNLLQITDGYLDLMKDDGSMPVEGLQRIDKILEATKKARELANRLVTLSPGGKPHRQKLNLTDVLRKVVRDEVKKELIQSEVDVASDLLPVRAEQHQLYTALKSIVKNSCESMIGAGKLIVLADNHREGKNEREAEGDIPAGNYISIVIRDTGCGMSSSQLSRIFDPYYTTKDMGFEKGVGLGLSIAYSIIAQHDGYIRVDSSEKKGTSVSVFLPADIPGGDQSN